ncbi:MAG: hypothetical protein DKM50_00380 [Candidatus Margulisiibacteriota bacterium]|nr:MAG: hypothetical protein DKM50_00380 [Candidatus Margulisiibacteriota bacterium]HCY38192.1 hypothetical protein [Candidatus Margulisiibacteriota bacterium]
MLETYNYNNDLSYKFDTIVRKPNRINASEQKKDKPPVFLENPDKKNKIDNHDHYEKVTDTGTSRVSTYSSIAKEIQNTNNASPQNKDTEKENNSKNPEKTNLQKKIERYMEHKSANQNEELKQKVEIQKLKAAEAQLEAHEMAHKMVGGMYAGFVTYTMAVGPDGKNYKVQGEVNLDSSAAASPEETVRKMERVISAAMAPLNPSPQDRSVVGRAAAMKMQAEQEIRRDKQLEEEYNKPDEQGRKPIRKITAFHSNVMGLHITLYA